MKKICSVGIVLAVAFLTLGILGACAKNEAPASYDYYSERSDYDVKTSDSIIGSSNNTYMSEDTSRKLIQRIYLEAETQNFSDSLDFLDTLVKQYGGYYESRLVSDSSQRYYYNYRSGDFVIRVPSDKKDAFVQEITKGLNVVMRRETTDDVTDPYTDVESKLSSLRAQQDRLMELMEQAETRQDLIALDDKLTDVLYEIEKEESIRRSYDKQIDMTAVSVSLYEVESMTPTEKPGFFERIGKELAEAWESFVADLEDTVVWFVSVQPAMLIISSVFLGIYFIIRTSIEKGKKKKAQRHHENNDAQ